MLLHRVLEERVLSVVTRLFPEAASIDFPVRPCPDARFGDYQLSALMALAKSQKTAPRPLAEQVRSALDVTDICEGVEVAGAVEGITPLMVAARDRAPLPSLPPGMSRASAATPAEPIS